MMFFDTLVEQIQFRFTGLHITNMSHGNFPFSLEVSYRVVKKNSYTTINGTVRTISHQITVV